jgi:hypothetical protein
MKCVPSCKIERSTLKNGVFHSQKWPVQHQEKRACSTPNKRLLHPEKQGVARRKTGCSVREKKEYYTPKTGCSVAERGVLHAENDM